LVNVKQTRGGFKYLVQRQATNATRLRHFIAVRRILRSTPDPFDKLAAPQQPLVDRRRQRTLGRPRHAGCHKPAVRRGHLGELLSAV